MLILRIKKENFEQIMGTYFKVCGILDPMTNIKVYDLFVDEDEIEVNVELEKIEETLN